MLLICVPVEIVQVLAGHEKISTTMDYVHLVDKIRARAIASAYSSAYKEPRNPRRY
jgi:site-specific recombinase XerD